MTIDEVRDNHDSLVEAYRSWPSTANRDKIIEMAATVVTSGRGDWMLPAIGMLDVVGVRAKKMPLVIRALIGVYKLFWCPPSRAGWNDYHMAVWRLTGDRASLVEIHRREHDGRYPAVQETAQWMVSSFSRQNAEFAAAMSEVRSSCVRCATANREAEAAPQCP